MKRALVIAATVAAWVVLARVLGSRLGTMDIGERIAAMPDTSPPKWIYTNVAAIRANTDRILALLEEQQPSPDPAAQRDA